MLNTLYCLSVWSLFSVLIASSSSTTCQDETSCSSTAEPQMQIGRTMLQRQSVLHPGPSGSGSGSGVVKAVATVTTNDEAARTAAATHPDATLPSRILSEAVPQVVVTTEKRVPLSSSLTYDPPAASVAQIHANEKPVPTSPSAAFSEVSRHGAQKETLPLSANDAQAIAAAEEPHPPASPTFFQVDADTANTKVSEEANQIGWLSTSIILIAMVGLLIAAGIGIPATKVVPGIAAEGIVVTPTELEKEERAYADEGAAVEDESSTDDESFQEQLIEENSSLPAIAAPKAKSMAGVPQPAAQEWLESSPEPEAEPLDN